MATSEWSSPQLRQHASALWFGVLAGPLGWMVHLLLIYGMAALTCTRGWPGFTILGLGGGQALIVLVTIVFDVMIAAAGLTAAGQWRQLQRADQRPGATLAGWMAFAGMLVSGVFFLAVLVAGLPALLVTLCR